MQHNATEMETDKETDRVCKTSQIIIYQYLEYDQKHNAVTEHFPRYIKAQ
jgi:hypothetical protein